jgi:outer membrane lipase/esterase
LHSTRALPLGPPHKTIKPKERFPMTTRRRWHISVFAAAALIVAGCGGGSTDAPIASRVVVFGDSLSDIGTYTPATSILRVLNPSDTRGAPYFGGKFTTNTFTEYQLPTAGVTRGPNTSTANMWVEWIAARLGVAITPAMSGFGPDTPTTRVRCPVTLTIPTLAGSCTGYAQGGSRVTNPAGSNNPFGTGLVGTTPTFTTEPMVTQVAKHHERFNGFADSDIVFVWGGHNDAFSQFEAVGQGLAPATAVANMVTAANELVALVKNEILARGASRVAVMTLGDASLAPGGAALPAVQRGLLSQLSAEFNAALVAGLNGTEARIIDTRAFLADAVANPSRYSLSNVTTPACGTPAFNTSGTALLCNASPASLFASGGAPNLNGLAAGASTTTWLWADASGHATTGGNKQLADFVVSAIKDFGWVPDNL